MGKAICCAFDCDRAVIARGYCTKHYQQQRTLGMAVLPPRRRRGCSVAGCDLPARGRGLCNAHHKRFTLTGDVQANVPIQRQSRGRTESCGVDGCDRTYAADGLCMAHYMERFEAQLKSEPCTIIGCSRPLQRRNFCAAHYWRWRTYGDPLAGGPFRAVRGTGNRWQYDENRRLAKAKMAQVTGETAEYVRILRLDPCAYCGAPSEHIDHIVPFSRGGPTDWMNLAPACAKCNYRKSATDLMQFMLSEAA